MALAVAAVPRRPVVLAEAEMLAPSDKEVLVCTVPAVMVAQAAAAGTAAAVLILMVVATMTVAAAVVPVISVA